MNLHAFLRRVSRDSRGSAAVEFAGIAIVLSSGLLNLADFGRYQIQKMQVVSAADAAAMAAFKACNTSALLPATKNCTALNTSITAVIQGTTLGNGVKLATGSPVEGYYCLDSSKALKKVGDVSSKPADCTAAGNPSATPGDYIQISLTFSYAPLFKGLTVMSALGVSSISASSWTRLD